MEKMLFSVNEAAAILGIGRQKVYQLLNTERLASVKIDASRRITREALEEFVAELEGNLPVDVPSAVRG